MTQEEKFLLITDLCARLPYGVKVQDTRCEISGKLRDMVVYPLYKGNNVYDYIAVTNFYTDCYYDDIELFKPYLFPLSSMTEEQQKEANIFDDMDLDILSENLDRNRRNKTNIPTPTFNYTDWLNKNHFDYRGLIEKGLAIDATGLNIY